MDNIYDAIIGQTPASLGSAICRAVLNRSNVVYWRGRILSIERTSRVQQYLYTREAR
jgi:hypothetical protein